jgi:hypothetical protein
MAKAGGNRDRGGGGGGGGSRQQQSWMAAAEQQRRWMAAAGRTSPSDGVSGYIYVLERRKVEMWTSVYSYMN